MTDQFSTEQQEYLKGFMSGVEARRGKLAPAATPASDPTDLQRAAQDRTVAEGGKLTPEEEAKRRRNPLDRTDEIAKLAAERIRIEQRLADPALYAPGKAAEVTAANTRLAAIARETGAAEAAWLAAEEAMEGAA